MTGISRGTGRALVVIAGVLVAACGGSSSNTNTGGAPYNVAIMSDLTGAVAITGVASVAGAKAYFGMVNGQGGVNGHQIKYTVQDNQTNAQAATANYQQAASQNNIAVLHGGSSAEFAAIVPLVQQTQVPIFTTSATDATLYPSPNPFVYMFAPSATQQGLATANFAKQQLGGSLTGKKIGFVGLTSPYIDSLLQVVTQQVTQGGGTMVDVERYATPIASFATQAAKIADRKPDAVINTGTAADTPTTVKAMVTAGITAPIISYSAGADTAIFQNINAKNYTALRAATVPDPGTAILAEAQKLGVSSSDTASNYYSVGWAMAAVITAAMKKCTSTCSASDVQKSLDGLSKYSVPNEAFYGPVTFSSKSHTAVSAGQFYGWDPATSSVAKVGSPVQMAG